MRPFLKLLLSEDGPAAVEYVVLLALIILALITSITAVGNSTLSSWTTVIGGLNGSW